MTSWTCGPARPPPCASIWVEVGCPLSLPPAHFFLAHGGITMSKSPSNSSNQAKSSPCCSVQQAIDHKCFKAVLGSTQCLHGCAESVLVPLWNGSWWQLAMQAAASQPMQPFKPPFQGCLQLGMAPRASQGVQLMPLQPQAWRVQPEPIWLPEGVQWHGLPWCQQAGAP